MVKETKYYSLEELICEFKIWSIEEDTLTKNSANNYAAYIRKAFAYLLEEQIPNGKEVVKTHNFKKSQKTTDNDYNNVVIYYEALLAKQSKNKTVRNSISGFRKFLIFMESQGYVFDRNMSDKDLKKCKDKQQLRYQVVYSNKDLKSIFKSRLKTQDRVYKHLVLPLRVINTLFKKEFGKTYEDFLDTQIDNIQYLIKDENINIRHRDVEQLELTEKNGIILTTKDGLRHFLYTDTKSGKQEMKASRIREVTIDHKTPLHDLTLNHHCPELHKLSDIVKKILEKSGEGITGRTLTKYKKLIDEYLIEDNEIDLEKLFYDFKGLYNKMDLVLMDGASNSSKGKN